MSRDTLTGSRIRERRIDMGMRQAELARLAGISPSYLNLIEHNRRRIGGKLLLDLSDILGVEPTLLTEGAEAAVLGSLREAAANLPEQAAEVDRVEEFAGRFPGWARIVHGLVQQRASLEQTIASLTDRMTHDPHLAESLHDILGAVTGIRSTSSILAGSQDIEPEWRTRFSRNIHEDAQRLAESSQALVSYLGAQEQGQRDIATPQDEIDRFLQSINHTVPSLEAGDTDPVSDEFTRKVDALIEEGTQYLRSTSSKAQVRRWLEHYARDAAVLPAEALKTALSGHGLDPLAISKAMKVAVPLVMRRLAALPGAWLEPFLQTPSPDGVGLVICDASGTMLYRKPVAGFEPPRFGAACPLWPLFQSLSHPLTTLSERLRTGGRDASDFQTFTACDWEGAGIYGEIALLRAHMLVVPSVMDVDLPGRSVGMSCRICPIEACVARREPSVLTQGV